MFDTSKYPRLRITQDVDLTQGFVGFQSYVILRSDQRYRLYRTSCILDRDELAELEHAFVCCIFVPAYSFGSRMSFREFVGLPVEYYP